MSNLHETTMELGHLASYRLAGDGTVADLDRRAFALLELEGTFPDPASVIGRPITDLIINPHPASPPIPAVDRAAAGLIRRRREVTFRTLRGNLRWIQVVTVPLGSPGAADLQVIIRDVTRSRLAEQGLRRSEGILRAVSFAAERFLHGEGWEEDIQRVLRRLGEAAQVSRISVFSNHAREDGRRCIRRRYHWRLAGLEAQNRRDGLQDLTYAEAGFERWEEILGHGVPIYGNVRQFPLAEQELLAGREILSLAVVPIYVGVEFWGFVCFEDGAAERDWSATEIDALRGAASTLGAALKQRADAEAIRSTGEQLRHAQKMEAVGRLAGGIAHDFNNLLTGIAGYGELLVSRLDPGDPLHGHALEIVRAGERAAALTRQLLAFSRKQVMRPRVLDLREVVKGMENLLQRLAGENVRVQVRTDRAAGRVRADPGQLEQVIMNLVANARDAMPGGGRLSIRIATATLAGAAPAQGGGLPAGRYVCLSVRDTGTGISPEVRARLFEPFFTTKPQGQGTGLGLATSYGIIRQSGGNILVQSKAGKGSVFRILLPLVEAPVEPERPRRRRPSKVGGSGTVLVVEDDPQVRRLAREILESGGYTVVEAGDGPEALTMAASRSAPLDLVLTDVVLPNLNGRQVHEEVGARCGAGRVLFMSGYAGSTVLPGGAASAGGPFLQKPFTPRSLLVKVREVLDGPALAEAGPAPTPDAPPDR